MKGGLVVVELLLHKINLGFSRAKHVHGSGQDGMVFSSVRSLSLPTFIRVKHHVVRWDSNVFAMR